jgi:hypothetical protein
VGIWGLDFNCIAMAFRFTIWLAWRALDGAFILRYHGYINAGRVVVFELRIVAAILCHTDI